MDRYSTNSLNENIEEILFSLDKKVFYILITFQAIFLIGLQIISSITNEISFYSNFVYTQIIILTFLVIIYFLVNDNSVGDSFFSATIIGFDITIMFFAFKLSKEDSNILECFIILFALA